MTIFLALLGTCIVCAVAPATIFVLNLRRYRAPEDGGEMRRIAVLIPARDEERNIAACVESVLASEGVELAVSVLDDASTDETAEIVRGIAARDARVTLLQSKTLPAGWNGKQHACWLLAQAADAPLLLFLDADVRLTPDALRRCVAEMTAKRLALLSGFPRLMTVGWIERLLLPLIHFVLLSFLPLARMRRSTNAAYAAGCGQFLLVQHTAYLRCGGHEAIRETRHDGLRLPRLFREHGLRTDIFDLTTLAQVRMYDSAGAVWNGLAKNATEGMASPAAIVPFTLLLGLGQIAPAMLMALWVMICAMNLVVGATFDEPMLAYSVGAGITVAFVASLLPRLIAVRRFRQPLVSAVLHPVGVVVLLVIQWYALLRQWMGRPVAWRARNS